MTADRSASHPLGSDIGSCRLPADSTESISDGWASFHTRWSRLRPPLRANDEVRVAIETLIAPHDRHVLLLGVTPELARVGRTLTAVDWNSDMIDRIWPGDMPGRRAVRADWRAMPPFPRPFSSAVGDGSLNALEGLGEVRAVLAAVRNALIDTGRIAIRCYVSPDNAETLDDLGASARSGNVPFHAFKWRLAMALCAVKDCPSIPVSEIAAGFDALFPDRDGLGAMTGWDEADLAEIDAYRRAAIVYNFPTASQLLACIPDGLANPRLIQAGSYPLADRCPILTADASA